MTNDVLTGSGLEEWMNRLEADLEESGSSAAAHLLERLRERPLRADSLEAIGRLHSLWMQAGDAEAARAVIDVDGAALAQAALPAEQADLATQLALYRLQIAEYLDEEAAMRSALTQLRALTAQPGLHPERFFQTQIFDKLEHNRLEIALAAIALRHALEEAIPERAPYRAWDAAICQARSALALSRHEQRDKAKEAAGQAIAALKTAASDQDVDEKDWLRLGDALIEIAPERLEDFRLPVTTLTQ
ncbi:MAG: hypothetical protein LBS89_00975, partial [Zoogloeaceae bacterium]|nr:hypothetical protein [Zoogloeaceae bacterium]